MKNGAKRYVRLLVSREEKKGDEHKKKLGKKIT